MCENPQETRPTAFEFILTFLSYLGWLLMSALGTALIAYLACLHHCCVCVLAPLWLLLMAAAWGDFHDE
jgi:hypothetical protein